MVQPPPDDESSTDLVGTEGDQEQADPSEDGTESRVEHEVEVIDRANRKLGQLLHGFRGPLPPPDMMAQYAQVQPDLPERIMRLTESEAAHRHQMDVIALHAHNADFKRGQQYGLAAVVLVLIVVLVALLLGNPTVAGSIGTTTVGLVAIAFYRKGFARDPKDDPPSR